MALYVGQRPPLYREVKKIKDDLKSTMYKKIPEKVALSCQSDNVYTPQSQTSSESNFRGTL